MKTNFKRVMSGLMAGIMAIGSMTIVSSAATAKDAITSIAIASITTGVTSTATIADSDIDSATNTASATLVVPNGTTTADFAISFTAKTASAVVQGATSAAGKATFLNDGTLYSGGLDVATEEIIGFSVADIDTTGVQAVITFDYGTGSTASKKEEIVLTFTVKQEAQDIVGSIGSEIGTEADADGKYPVTITLKDDQDTALNGTTIGATVEAGGTGLTAESDGTYKFNIAVDTPVKVTATAAGYTFPSVDVKKTTGGGGNTPDPVAAAEYDYAFYSEIPGQYSAITELSYYNASEEKEADREVMAYTVPSPSGKVADESPLTIWMGGGKATLATGTVDDTKTRMISLYAYDTANDAYYNITNAKTTVFAISDKKDAPALANGKAPASTLGKISKGKLTGPKSGDTKTMYVHAYANVTKENTKGDYCGYAIVNIKAAGTVVETHLTATPAATDKAVKAVVAPVGVSVPVYVKGYANKTKAAGSDDTTYTVAVTKGTTFAQVSADNENFSTGFTTGAGADAEFYVQGVSIDTDKKKPAKASITITNNQSGKKASMNATVDQSVLEFSKIDAVTVTAKKGEKVSVDLEGKAFIAGSTEAAAIKLADTTDKGKVLVVTSAKEDALIAANLIDKGKLKAGTALTKAADLAAKLNGTKVDIEVKKDTLAAGTYYVVVGYNANTWVDDKETEATTDDVTVMRGVAIIPVTVGEAAKEYKTPLKSLKVGTVDATLTADNKYTASIKTKLADAVDFTFGLNATDDVAEVVAGTDYSVEADKKSVKFTKAGEVTVKLKVTPKGGTETAVDVVVTVEDTTPAAATLSVTVAGVDVTLGTPTANAATGAVTIDYSETGTVTSGESEPMPIVIDPTDAGTLAAGAGTKIDASSQLILTGVGDGTATTDHVFTLTVGDVVYTITVTVDVA